MQLDIYEKVLINRIFPYVVVFGVNQTDGARSWVGQLGKLVRGLILLSFNENTPTSCLSIVDFPERKISRTDANDKLELSKAK